MKTRQAIYKYRLCWLAKLTGATGHGDPIFDTFPLAREAERIFARETNVQFPGLFSYWVEKVEVKEQQKEVA